MSKRGTLHLLVGPVGAGKSTYARKRIAGSPAVFLDLDEWMVRLFGNDPRPEHDVMGWYLERRARCHALIWGTATAILESGSDVFVELGLVRRKERETIYQAAADLGVPFKVYLVDAPRDTRRQRVAERNATAGPFTQVVPPEFFERASDAWEPPTEEERSALPLVDV